MAALLALLSHAGCSKSGRNSSDEVHALASGTYVGGSEKDARQMEVSVSQIEANVVSSAESALDSFSPSFSFNGQPAEAVVQKYLYPSGPAVLSAARVFQIKNVEGQLDGSKATLRVTVEGSLDVETKGGTHRVVEQGTYAYFMEQTGGEWKVAGIRPLAVAVSRGEAVSHPGLLAEALINGSPVSTEGDPFQAEPGQELTVECGFLGTIGERVLLSGAPLEVRRHALFTPKETDAQSYETTVKLRPDLQPGHYFLEIQSEIRAGEDNGTNLLYSLPLQIGNPPDRLAAMPTRLGKEGRGSAGTATPVNAVPPAGRKAPARRIAAAVNADDRKLVQDAISIFLDHASSPPVTDLVVLAGLIADLYPHDGLRNYVENGYSTLLNSPDHLSPNFLRMVPGRETTTPFKEPLCGAEGEVSSTDCLILSSVWCDVVAPSDSLLKDLQAAVSRAHSRGSRDQAKVLLFALSELRRKPCLNPAHVEALFRQAARLVQQLAEASPDGYGPGVAALLFTGLADEVQPEWIDRIRETLRTQISSPITCAPCIEAAKPLLYETYAVARWNSEKGTAP